MHGTFLGETTHCESLALLRLWAGKGRKSAEILNVEQLASQLEPLYFKMCSKLTSLQWLTNDIQSWVVVVVVVIEVVLSYSSILHYTVSDQTSAKGFF